MTNLVYLITPLSMVNPWTYAISYIIAIIAVFLMILVLFVKYSSLRKYTRKRNIMVYCAFILTLGLLMFQVDSVSRRAYVGYGLGMGSGKAYVGEVNESVWSCSNHGDRSADFYLVINSVNASFIIQKQEGYVLASNTTIKVPFSLSGNSESKPVFYIIDKNVAGFYFSTSIENRGYGGFDVTTAMSGVTFVWNATGDYYILKYVSVASA
jgi:hypothetical protein